MKRTNMVSNMPMIGIKTDTIDNVAAAPVSTVETIGLPIPTVVAVETALVAEVLLDIAAAVPPPAIIAKDQVKSGSKSTKVETMTAVPAMAANGTAMVSNRLSIKGI